MIVKLKYIKYGKYYIAQFRKNVMKEEYENLSYSCKN